MVEDKSGWYGESKRHSEVQKRASRFAGIKNVNPKLGIDDVVDAVHRNKIVNMKNVSATIDELSNEELNYCDKCQNIENSTDLIWVDSEDFEPKAGDKFNKQKYSKAIKKGYSALCDSCYEKECCGK